jgi:predicted enzyme related to lactoylglutathione lyase
MLRGLTTSVMLADDLQAAKAWYTRALGIEPYFNRAEYIEFRLGDYQHEFGILDRKYSTAEPGALPRPAPAGVVTYWHVDDVTATMEHFISLGARELEAPREYGAGFIGASVIDPFGNILGLMYNPHYLEMLAKITGK